VRGKRVRGRQEFGIVVGLLRPSVGGSVVPDESHQEGGLWIAFGSSQGPSQGHLSRLGVGRAVHHKINACEFFFFLSFFSSLV
jgi:hypothetical protein